MLRSSYLISLSLTARGNYVALQEYLIILLAKVKMNADWEGKEPKD
jgi:hypothetical protein